jgi:hypothetical protein
MFAAPIITIDFGKNSIPGGWIGMGRYLWRKSMTISNLCSMIFGLFPKWTRFASWSFHIQSLPE